MECWIYPAVHFSYNSQNQGFLKVSSLIIAAFSAKVKVSVNVHVLLSGPYSPYH